MRFILNELTLELAFGDLECTVIEGKYFFFFFEGGEFYFIH